MWIIQPHLLMKFWANMCGPEVNGHIIKIAIGRINDSRDGWKTKGKSKTNKQKNG